MNEINNNKLIKIKKIEIDLENNNNSKSVSLNSRLCLCLFKSSKTSINKLLKHLTCSLSLIHWY